MAYNLWKFFGLQRSGNHAVINWLMGLDQENTLFFNARKPGQDIFSAPRGVSLPVGHKAHAVRVSGKKIINDNIGNEFINRKETWKLLISYENHNMEYFDECSLNKPIIDSFGIPSTSVNFFIIRNPFSVLSSTERFLRSKVKKWRKKKWSIIQKFTLKDDDFIENNLDRKMLIWKTYAFLTLYPNSTTRGSFIPIIFDRWVEDKAYRDQLARSLGCKNLDRFVDFVSDAGTGSSFEGTDVKDPKSTLSRWEQGNKKLCRKLILRHPEVVDYASIIFGDQVIPKDVQTGFIGSRPVS